MSVNVTSFQSNSEEARILINHLLMAYDYTISYVQNTYIFQCSCYIISNNISTAVIRKVNIKKTNYKT